MRIISRLHEKFDLNSIKFSSGLLLFLIIICVISSILAVILYLYLVESSKQIENISIDYVKLNSISTITYLKEIIQNKILVVSSNLDILSSLVLIKQQNLSAIPNFEAAQSTTNDLTEGYGWIDENGMGVWSTAFSGNDTTFHNYANLNASERQYFKIPKETYKPFVSEAFMTTNYNQVPRIVIAYPILSLKPNAISTATTNLTDIKQNVTKNLFDTNNITTSITDIVNEKNHSMFEIQPILYNLDTNYLKDNYEFKGIVTASINSAALDNYINNALSTRNIFNNTNDSNGSLFTNESSFRTTSNSNESMNIEYSNIIQAPPISSIIFPFSPSASSTYEALSETLKPNVLVTDNTGIILFSSDERIMTGSNYISTENLDVIKKGYDNATAEFLISVLYNLTSNKEISYSGTLDLINKQGDKIIVNFEPILFNGKHIFYLSTNTKFFLSETANNLISNQIVFTFLFVGCLLFMVFSFIAIVLLINKKLKREVTNKTNQLLQNVQDLKLSNEKLVQSEEMEREFVNTAAHELRTPTQAIMGYSELNDDLFDDIFKNDRVGVNQDLKRSINQLFKHHESISRNASRLDTLINNLLDIARLESGSSSTNILVTLQKEKIDLIKEINDIINFQLRNKINDKNIKINFINNSLGEHCWVYVDRSRLNQIFNNLLDNAIKFSKKDSGINILVKEEIVDLDKINNQGNRKTETLPKDTIKDVLKRREVYVAISDTGKGLSSNMLSKLFGKFVTDSDYGTGLGLFITKKLVEAHGGSIWAYNNKDGIGATFIFSLPMIEDNEDKNTSN